MYHHLCHWQCLIPRVFPFPSISRLLQELHHWPPVGREDLRPGLRHQSHAIRSGLRAVGGHWPSVTAHAPALDVLGECPHGQVHLQEWRLVLCGHLMGDPDVRPGTALRRTERQGGLWEHRTHLPGRQETRKWGCQWDRGRLGLIGRGRGSCKSLVVPPEVVICCVVE